MACWIHAGGLLALGLAINGTALGQQACEQQLQQLEDALQEELLDGQMQRQLQELINEARSAPDADCQEIAAEARQQLEGLGDSAPQPAQSPAAGVQQDAAALAQRGNEVGTAAEPNEIIGAAVVTADGDEVGEISALTRARADGTLHALVDVGGFLGLGERTVAVPVDRLDSDTEGRLIMRLTREELERLPEYASTEYAALDDDSRSLR